MGVFKMPTVQQFLDKKVFYDPKKDPVWVYLENEMIANIDKKPYNEKVGAWLKYLKDLKYYQFCEARTALKRLNVEVGPPWYIELSTHQREILKGLKASIHQDLLEDLPSRTRRSLSDLGITLKVKKTTLMNAMATSAEDPGIFIWNLYTAYFNMPPSQPRKSYSMNAMILMSSLVFIDLEECISRLQKLVKLKKPPPPRAPKPQKKSVVPTCRYGVYLEKPAPLQLYSNHPSGPHEKRKPEIDYKFRFRSQESYTVLRNDLSFLEKRKERNKRAQNTERVCNYKFWEPPSNLRSTDPNMAALAGKMKMLKLKAVQKYKAPYKNVQYLVSGVSFSGGRPNYILSNVAIQPTGFIPINAGIVYIGSQFVTTLHGYWKYPRPVIDKCDTTCDCLSKWDKPVMEYLYKSRCKCGHLYDYYNEGKSKEKYFYQPTKHVPYSVDYAKIFQMDPMEDFIKDTVKEALESGEPTPAPSQPTISPSGQKLKDLLAAFLADLSDTPLIIPHLPGACLLNNLQEWVRKRVSGSLTATDHKQNKLYSLRRWLDLKHVDFRARAGMVPFTLKELEHMDWSYRKQVQVLFWKLLEDFTKRNQLKQIKQTRLWWPTMKFDAYPSKEFLDIYFTYMPGRMKDTFLVRPYSSENTPKYGAKTCPLNY
ncbi:uncharacterized protein LOC106138064 [Amyelois transitella]|uniref:uncharacterized protein LOC106138064 n=1 Tax=Amyelois transitella TaxID=680683 RepID=UPI0029900257|nr:uncharacterized protein LOC106138064 [Amyelois transitella]